MNGGIPRRTSHRTKEQTTWAKDHIGVTGIFSIGSEKPCSLCGELGSKFWAEEWGYPEIGVYFADCPSAGHDMICLDYRACGPSGEPLVVHIDQECDYKIVFVAENFEAFIRGLEDDSTFDEEGATTLVTGVVGSSHPSLIRIVSASGVSVLRCLIVLSLKSLTSVGDKLSSDATYSSRSSAQVAASLVPFQKPADALFGLVDQTRLNPSCS